MDCIDKAVLLSCVMDRMARAIDSRQDNLKMNRSEHHSGPAYFNHFTTTGGHAYDAIFQAIDMVGVKKARFLDLGCGLGIVGHVVWTEKGVKAYGYDINQDYVNIANYLGNFAHVKDITTLRAEDVKFANIIYFWDPILDRELSAKFIKNLIPLMKRGQIIIHNASGPQIREPLLEATKKGWVSILRNPSSVVAIRKS